MLKLNMTTPKQTQKDLDFDIPDWLCPKRGVLFNNVKEPIPTPPKFKNNNILNSTNMNAVYNNPYRTLGLFGNSSERELQKQIATIKRFAEVGKTKAFDYDFPFFGEVVRSTEKVQEAASKIEQAKNKVHYALFWFLNSGHIDEAALNNLKEGHIEKATEIWEKTLKDSTVTAKNFAAISNLSTLQLGIVTYNGSFDPEKFTASIELKGKLIMSDACDSFITMVIGEGISINRGSILKEFADEVIQITKPYLNKTNGLESSQLICAFNSFPNEIRQYVSGKFTDRPLNNIESQIEKTKQKRDDNPNDAEEYGEELYNNTKVDLVFLKNVWGANNVQYQMIANKVANEIMQCAIEYYNYHQNEETGIDPGDNALKIAKYSLSIGPTGQIKNRIEENTKPIQEWVNAKPQRQQQEIIKSEILFITKQLIDFQKKSNSISVAVDFVNSCKIQLDGIKVKLSPQNENYLNLSTAVASNAQGMVIGVVNIAMEKRNKYVEYINDLNKNPYRPSASYLDNQYLRALYGNSNPVPYAPEYSLEELKSVIKEAWSATKLIGSLDMLSQQRGHYNKNQDALKSIAEQLGINTSVGQYIKNATGGCYIATMAYGSYEHPQVLELRKFRDNTLSKSSFGRGFIKTYYKYSPKLVEHLKDKPLINQTIKSILNTLIRIIK